MDNSLALGWEVLNNRNGIKKEKECHTILEEKEIFGYEGVSVWQKLIEISQK